MKNSYNPNISRKFTKDTIEIFPQHDNVQNWLIGTVSKECTTKELSNLEDEANLADALSRVAVNNGLSVNDVSHLYPAILRMLKVNNDWTK